MANAIGAYDPTFLAQESLIHLRNALGMGNRVYMGYDTERRTYKKGSVIEIPKPGTFTVTEGGAGTIQDLSTDSVNISLDLYKEVLFVLTDKELAYTGDQIIREHIAPATYALANYVDAALTGLYKDIPWSFDDTASSYANFLGCRKVLRDVAGDLVDRGDNYFAIDSVLEASYLGLNEWKDASVIGAQSQGLIMGSIGERAGVQPFVNQNLASHTSGTVVSAGTDIAGALTADAAKGAETITIDGLDGVETIVAGDSFVIAGDTQRYAATATTTLAAGAGSVTFTPPLAIAYSDNDVVTFEAGDGATVHADSYYSNIMFNRRFAALAFAPLPEHKDEPSANIQVITDPLTGMSIRARTGYSTQYSKKFVGFDILCGIKTLDPNMAVIYRRNK